MLAMQLFSHHLPPPPPGPERIACPYTLEGPLTLPLLYLTWSLQQLRITFVLSVHYLRDAFASPLHHLCITPLPMNSCRVTFALPVRHLCSARCEVKTSPLETVQLRTCHLLDVMSVLLFCKVHSHSQPVTRPCIHGHESTVTR